MKALIAKAYAPVDQLTVSDVPKPEPGPGQVQVQVQAAAVNPFDIRLVTGELRHVFEVEHPLVLGMEASGVVTDVGEEVHRFSAGDEVVAFTFGAAGSIAEYTLVTEGPNVTLRPPSLDPVPAAAIPVAALTAASLLDVAELDTSQSMLVVGATGGVGLFTVQMAALTGARVLATAPATEAAYVRGLGAHETIDYTQADTTTEALRLQPGGVDVVVDLAHGGEDATTIAAAAKPGGRLVSPLHGGPDSFDRGVSAAYIHVGARNGLLQQLVASAAEGALTVTVARTYPFSDAPQAVADFLAEHTCGKVVITF